jgi:Fe-S cluster assembly protein SufD
MTLQQDIPLYEEVVNGFDRLTDKVSGNESSGLRKARRQAFERFRESGFPTIKSEDWKYTNVNRFLKEEYALGVASAPASAELVATAVIGRSGFALGSGAFDGG